MTDFLIGIAHQHRVALLCVLATPLLAVQGWRVVKAHARSGSAWARRLRDGWDAAPALNRWAAWLLLLVAAVHLALPLSHSDSALLTVGFLGSGAAAGWLAVRAVVGRHWRAATVWLVLGMLTAYTFVVASGREESDQVGLATAVVELALLALAAVPALTRPWSAPGLGRPPGRSDEVAPGQTWRRRLVVRPLANTGIVALTVVFGVAIWVAFVAGHDDHGTGDHGMGEHGMAGRHHGEFLARAQAGIVLRPAGPPATPEQARAAALLAERTKAAVAKYRGVVGR